MPRRAAWHREIVVEPFALAFTALVPMAEEVRILEERVRVDVHDLNVAAGVEDFLRAVAVVVVDVEHRDPVEATVTQMLRRQRADAKAASQVPSTIGVPASKA